MKKAKRLLAVIMAAVMLFSAACIPSYAYVASSDNYYVPQQGADGKYYLSYEQAAGWVLDLLDDMLKESNIIITCDDLNDMVGIGINIFTSNIMLNLDGYLEDAGATHNGQGSLIITSVDGLIKSLVGLMSCLEDNGIAKLGSALGLFGDLLSDDLGTASLKHVGSLDAGTTRFNGVSTDRAVLEMLVTFIYEKKDLVVGLIAGTVGFGSLLSGFVGDLIADFLPGAYFDGDNKLVNVDGGLKNMLYNMLVGANGEAGLPEGQTLDEAIQQVVDWALITGTGTTAETGANSLLGENMEPLMPAIATKPGAAGVIYSTDTFKADRDGDGELDSSDYTMNTYQFVANLLDALLGGMLGPILSDLLYGLVDIEITEEFPYGDPAIMGDQMFSLIIGLVESLLVQNGAPEPKYTEEENTYPALKIDAMVRWLFEGGALDTFILIDYNGIQIQDNFMSLLNDLIRLLVNMLPSFGLFADSAHLGYQGDELTQIWYHDGSKNLVAEGAEGAVDQTYITYENDEILYATEYQMVDGVNTATAYNYLSNDMPVNISDSGASDYRNPKFIRPNYVVKTTDVYATVIKMALNDMIEGCYFPEWATDIPTVLAYGLAALAAPATPANNYYARLDAYHELIENGGVGVVVDANNNELDPIPYSIQKAIPIYDTNGVLVETKYATVPKGAIDIGCSYLAAYLNTLFQFNSDAHKLSTDTTFEQFLSEFLIWGFTKYAPLFSGQDRDNNGKMDQYIQDSNGNSTGVSASWYNEVNVFIDAIYSDFAGREYKETANFDAVYDLIDSTLFSLIPTSWLPNINGSNQFINDWLLGNLIEFDLQGILGLLTVNHDVNAELNANALIPVVIRVLDRVLAAVFGDNAIMYPSGRTNVVKNQNVTTIKTLDELLTSGGNTANPLPVLLDNLLTAIQKYKVPLLGTFLPLLAGAEYERPYDTSVLGELGNTYNVEYLEEYVDYFSDNVNASLVTTVDDEYLAENWVAQNGTIVRTADGTAYEIQLGDEKIVYGPYTTRAEAKETLEMVKGCYVSARETGEVIDETTGEVTVTYVYDIYRPWSYLDTATENPNAIDPENGETYSTYSDFRFANLNNRNPKVSYEENNFRFFNYEDFGKDGFAYRNAKDSIKEADEFTSSYRDYAVTALPEAYGEWLLFSVEARLRQADLYDSNDDGYSVTSDTDTDYIAPTTDADGNVTDEGIPVDGAPGLPTAMYPFRSSASTGYTFKDPATGNNLTVAMADINEIGYEQLQMAIDYGMDPENDVTLSVIDSEKVVRLALGSLAFDITPKADGSYNAGSAQWETLTSSQLTAIGSWCIDNGFRLEINDVVNEAGETVKEYLIKRSAFNYFTSSFNLGLTDVTATPITTAEWNAMVAQTQAEKDANRTEANDYQYDIYKCYIDYISTMYANRRSLYNAIDYIGYRHELAENTYRLPSTDVTMLNWVINHTKNAYKDPSTNLRNQYDTGDFDTTTNENIYDKVYTTTSYEAFRKAVDYGTSLVAASKNSILADELTQSMVSEAYIGILKAYYALVKYTGAADWTELNSYIATATEIMNDPNKNDPVLGYASGLDILELTLNDAVTLKTDSEIDSERQDEVDLMAAALRQAILNLVYNTVPSIVTQVTESGENEVGTVKVSNVNNRVVGQIFGLTEGTGAVMELIKVVGMLEDASTGNVVSIEGSGRGYGTGSYYKGTLGGIERFRYYAVVYGDINGDSRIDGTDASALEIYIALQQNDSNGMGSFKYEAGDANHDGVVDGLDVEAMVDHYTYETDENGNLMSIDQTEHSSGATVEDGDTDNTGAAQVVSE